MKGQVVASLATIMVATTCFLSSIASAQACPALPTTAAPAEVLAGRNAALAAGDMHLAFCHYAEDAIAVTPGSVATGREQIKAAFMQFGALFGGAQPDVSSVTTTDKVALITFSSHGESASIPDGADSFIIEKGLIKIQTVHATIVFTAPGQ